MISLNDVLLAMSNIPVDDPIAEIWGRGLQSGYKIIEYTGSLPITINENGDVLLDYRIYGADSGVGEPTENLWNPNTAEKKYIVFDGTISNKQTFALNTIPIEAGSTYYFYALENYTNNITYWQFQNNNDEIVGNDRLSRNLQRASFDAPSGATKVIICFANAWDNDKIRDFGVYKRSTAPTSYIPYGYKLPMVTRGENLFDPNDPGIERGYYYGYNNGITTAYGDNSWESGWIPVTPGNYTFYLRRFHVGFYLYLNFYNSQKEFVNTILSRTNPNGFYTVTITDVGYIRFNGINVYSTDWLVARGNVTKYTPYSRTDTPVYIGENQLKEDEYVSYSEQKIYRDVSGTLTPTDPPVPLPEIPTINGETIIDYDGTPKPSQMYIKYKG